MNIRKLRKALETHIEFNQYLIDRSDISKRITIKRKKKMILEQIPNGDIKLRRRSVIKIEIIE